MGELIGLLMIVGIIFGLFYAVVLLVMPFIVWLIYDHISQMNRKADKTNILLDEISGYFRKSIDNAKR